MPEITALEHATQLGRMKQLRLTWGYYRQPNGWITVSPATDIEELKYRRGGWEPLPQYGRVEMASQYAVDHPLEMLFMLGGAKELPVEQIIEMALHLHPPLIPSCGLRLDQNHKRHQSVCWENAQPVSFPQLVGDYPSFQCRFCSRAPFSTEEKRDQHEGVMHKDEKGDIRTGEVLAESLTRGLKEAGAVRIEVDATKPYACGICGDGFISHIKLAQHVKNEHKEDASGVEDTTGADEAPTGEGTTEAPAGE